MRQFRGKQSLLNILHTLLSVPTVVVGLVVYSMVCRQSPLGFMGLLFTPAAMVIGQVLLALPITVVLSYTAVAAVDAAAGETARTLGAGRVAAAFTMISEGRAGILAAVTATFGRLIGEVGVAMIVGGNIAGYTRTITTAIALETSKGEVGISLQLGAILLCISLGVNLLLQFLKGSRSSG